MAGGDLVGLTGACYRRIGTMLPCWATLAGSKLAGSSGVQIGPGANLHPCGARRVGEWNGDRRPPSGLDLQCRQQL
jgi:hypothetical protein